jgi:hypothetical protein
MTDAEDEGRADQAAFMSALVTEHFVLQSAAGVTVSEASGRTSPYLTALSSSLIALGFAAQAPGAFAPFAAVLLPTVVVMGLFTIVRLIDTGVQNLTFQAGIARIRGYYRTIRPESAAYFTEWGGPNSDEATQAMAAVGVKFGPLVGFSTTASMIATINSIVTGAGVALGCVWATGRDQLPLAVLLGLATVVVSMAVFYRYQNRRFQRFRLTGEQHATARRA